MPYRTPHDPRKCRCVHRHVPLFGGFGPHVSDVYVWNCCRCFRENNAPLQFCRACGHARDLFEREVDQCLVDLGLAKHGTYSRGPS